MRRFEPRRARESGPWLVHLFGLEGCPHGAIEWETDRVRFIGRGKTIEAPRALDGRALSGTTGITLDPIVSLRQRIRVLPGNHVRLTFSTGVAADQDTVRAIAHKYGQPNAAPRTFARATARLTATTGEPETSISAS